MQKLYKLNEDVIHSILDFIIALLSTFLVHVCIFMNFLKYELF